MNWSLSHRFDPSAVALADRHYNRQKPGTPQFVPPGRCLVLLADAALWVTSWPFAEYTKHAWAGAWVNTLFRREGGEMIASEMIRDAIAATRWYFGETPPLGMVSFVDPSKVRRKRDPGRCYLRAGFKRAKCPQHEAVDARCNACFGLTEAGLLAFQIEPQDMPEPRPPRGVTLDLFGSNRMKYRRGAQEPTT